MQVSSAALDLLKGLLQRDPAQRVSVAQALEHPWLRAAMGATCDGPRPRVAFEVQAPTAPQGRQEEGRIAGDPVADVHAVLAAISAPARTADPDTRVTTAAPPPRPTQVSAPQVRNRRGFCPRSPL